MNALPESVHDVMMRFGVGDVFSLREKLSSMALEGSKHLASQGVNVGQNTFQFLIRMGNMPYLLFFMLRYGGSPARHSRSEVRRVGKGVSSREDYGGGRILTAKI